MKQSTMFVWSKEENRCVENTVLADADAEGRESDGEDPAFYCSEKDGLYQGIREHCYFHENPHEIEQNKFFPIKSHNVYEILLNLIGGAIRRVTVIYRK